MADHDRDDLLAPLRAAASGARVAPPDDVRRRGDRRTRNARLLAGAAVLAVCAGTGITLASASSAQDSLRPPPVAATPTPTDTPSATPSPGAAGAPVVPVTGTPSVPPGSTGRPSGSPSSATAKAGLTVDLVRTSAPGAAHLTYTARVTGLVPQVSDAQTGAALAGKDQLLATGVQFGDGATDGSDGGALTCRPGAKLVPVDMTFDNNPAHDYAPGTWTLSFQARACGITATDTLVTTVAAPSAPATTVTLAGPVDASGALLPGYTVTATVAADSCSPGSDAIGRGYRCSAGSGVYDPCWPSAGSPLEVLCLGSAFTSDVTRLTLTSPLEPLTDPASQEPWGLLLAGGAQCTLLQGAHDDVQGRVVDYSCGDGTVVLRGLDRSRPAWQAARARLTNGSYTLLPPAAVTTAYLPRPAG